MSPADLQPARVHASLAQLRQLLEDLTTLVGEPSAQDLRTDRARRHVAERVLTQLVEIAASVNSHIAAARLGKAPADYRESFALAAEAGALSPDTAAELRDAAGMRNVLVHQYLDIDLEAVAAAVPRAGSAFGAYVRDVARFLAEQQAGPSD
jgi:uncharacterized protein YutE (UPF0331/DUF86 family)